MRFPLLGTIMCLLRIGAEVSGNYLGIGVSAAANAYKVYRETAQKYAEHIPE